MALHCPSPIVLVLGLNLQGGDHHLRRPHGLHGPFEGLLILIPGFTDLHGRHGGHAVFIEDIFGGALSLMPQPSVVVEPPVVLFLRMFEDV